MHLAKRSGKERASSIADSAGKLEKLFFLAWHDSGISQQLRRLNLAPAA